MFKLSSSKIHILFFSEELEIKEELEEIIEEVVESVLRLKLELLSREFELKLFSKELKCYEKKEFQEIRRLC